MKNQTKLTYHGLVEIKIKNKDGSLSSYKKHNEGLDTLFIAFMKLLLGEAVSEYRPTRIGLFDNNEEAIQGTVQPISGLVGSTTGYQDITNNPCIKLTAFIPFVTNIDNSKYLYLLKGTGNEEEDQLARIDVSTSGISSLSSGQSLLINWYLYLDNQGEQ